MISHSLSGELFQALRRLKPLAALNSMPHYPYSPYQLLDEFEPLHNLWVAQWRRLFPHRYIRSSLSLLSDIDSAFDNVTATVLRPTR